MGLDLQLCVNVANTQVVHQMNCGLWLSWAVWEYIKGVVTVLTTWCLLLPLSAPGSCHFHAVLPDFITCLNLQLASGLALPVWQGRSTTCQLNRRLSGNSLPSLSRTHIRMHTSPHHMIYSLRMAHSGGHWGKSPSHRTQVLHCYRIQYLLCD